MRALQLARWNGKSWIRFGDILEGPPRDFTTSRTVGRLEFDPLGDEHLSLPVGTFRWQRQSRSHHLAIPALPTTHRRSRLIPSIHREDDMIYELRIYECVPGRLPDLNKRFSTITLKIWERHGIKQAGFWTTLIGESNMTLYYMLAWESLAERETKWAAFMADPEWHSARAKTEENGPIVAKVTNYILGPTPYSSVK
jgi:hypothetical protein